MLDRTEEIDRLIAITKSDSKISGPDLAKAHIRLGEIMGENMNLPANDTTIIAVMRGGIFFAQGIYFSLGCRFQTFDPKYEQFVRPETTNIILVDSVINTGKTIKSILDEDMLVACCVINANVAQDLNDQLYTVRVSQNSYVGASVKKQQGNIGPDTTMRLFNQI